MNPVCVLSNYRGHLSVWLTNSEYYNFLGLKRTVLQIVNFKTHCNYILNLHTISLYDLDLRK